MNEKQEAVDLLGDADQFDAPFVLAAAWRDGRLDNQQLRNLLPQVWIQTESPTAKLSSLTWVRMFKAAGFCFRYVEPASYPCPHFTTAPTHNFDVWRGAPLTTDGRGMSWTLDRSRARWFAERCSFATTAGLWRATIPGRAVLAIFNDIAEQEIVVNPFMLTGRVHLEESLEDQSLAAAHHWQDRFRG